MTNAARIVIAEDEGDLLEDLKEMTNDLGYEVVGTARTGRELIDRCRECDPDLVITDVRMPEMDGLDAGRILHAERPIPMVVVSAYKDDELIDRAAAGNVYAYLLKPINPPELDASIRLALSRFQEAHPDLCQRPQPCAWFG